MKLKHRLSIYSIAIFSIIMMVFSAAIYFTYYVQMEKKERQSLESKSLLAAIFYLEQDELSLREHAHVRSELYKNISRKNIAVFDRTGALHSGEMESSADISDTFLRQVTKYHNGFFSTDTHFYNGIFYPDNEGDFVVVTREVKTEFKSQMRALFHILLAVFVLGVLAILFFSQILSHIAYQPILNIVNQIRDRDSRNFMEPITLQNTYTEIQILVDTYNLFINRITETFNVQKNFIDYVSHELRTPIAALMGTLEVTKNKPRSSQEYRHVIAELQQYTKDFQETLDQMMLLSGAQTSVERAALRVDEVVWNLIEKHIRFHAAQIDAAIEVSNHALFQIQGNEKLLELAIGNIIENAIKYSDNKVVKITMREESGRLVIAVDDQGIGIPEQDTQHIMQNFFRGQNAQQYTGKGVGLSIANIIFKLHDIALDIRSSEQGTSVMLRF